ncbi:unnamed protein product [Cyprideis torosa]|uniref:Kinesin-like protein n=1 Tax=Cyprideis torosa TaxID=163714 RepID=A0A7R8ZJ27_9CRUS|nr:unnamed protein product [Cyprideis torosa]CAG0885983.1 unnamed protein product [Cyprideis torosa]
MKEKVSFLSECVKVVVRCRPLSAQEVKDKRNVAVKIFPDVGGIEVAGTTKDAKQERPRTFTFDAVYGFDSKQQDMYDETFRPLVNSVLEGFNGTIFAYGQTGTGKTFTMQGESNISELRGVIPNAFDHIFSHIARSENQQYLVRASYLEIYMEEIRDLLAKDPTQKLEIKESPDQGVYVKDLSPFVCKSVQEIQHVMSSGNRNRAVGRTDMNEHSSRSHAIFIITVESSVTGPDGSSHIRVGKLNLVDLAGSERQSKTGAIGDRFKEATKINLSLSALGNVISALTGRGGHIPYRDSKLTRLLQDSLGGNAKTVMVANVGPADYNMDETVTTLRYASRAKEIKNKPRINEDPKDALLREFQEEISRLKAALASRGSGKKGAKRSRRPSRRRGEGKEEGGDGEVEEEGLTEEEWREQQRALEAEKESILNDKNLIAEERDRLLEAAKQKEEQLRANREKKRELEETIRALESKLLCGGKNIVDRTNAQERALQKRREELMEEKRKQREMKQRLEQEEETTTELQGTFSSLRQELDAKNKKLKKLELKVEATKREMADGVEDFEREREELTIMQNNFTKELKKVMLIVDNFIPPSETSKVTSQAVWDEEAESWVLSQREADSSRPSTALTKRPVSAVGARRPMSEYARAQSAARRHEAVGGGRLQTESIRYKGENIMTLPLEFLGPTTREWEGPRLSPYLQAALDEALKGDDGDLDIDAASASLGIPGVNLRGTRKPVTAAASASRSQKREAASYPSARGLVKR